MPNPQNPIKRWIDATNSNPARAKRAPLELASDVLWSLLGRPLPKDIYQKYEEAHRSDPPHDNER